MHRILGLVTAVGLILGMASLARAQDTGFGFAGFPAGITTGSDYGFVPGGYAAAPPATSYRPTYPGTTSYGTGSYRPAYPGTTSYGTGYYGTTPGAVYPGQTSYSAGYYGLVPNTVNPGTTYYPNSYTSSSPLYAYPSARSYAPYYGSAPTYVWPRGGVLRGMMGGMYR